MKTLLDGFEQYHFTPATRPAKGRLRITISAYQVTFSKELVAALGSPAQVTLYKKESQFAIKGTTRGGFAFVKKRISRGRKDGKVVTKDPALLDFFKSFVGETGSGIYYTIDAVIEDKIAFFDGAQAARYEMDPEVLKKLKKG